MSGLFGGGGDDPAKAAAKIEREQMERLANVEDAELREYILQNPELVGLLEAEQVGPSALEEISLDPAMRENQLAALEGLRERADEGLTATDRFQMEQLLGDVGAQQQARQAQVEDQMAQRGMDSSGAALMAQLQGDQSGANTARQKAMQMAAQGQQNRSQALQALGQQSGQMEQAEFGRGAQVASARDAIARANAMNRQQVSAQNLGARQSIENQRAGIANQQAQVGNQLAQQRFQNEMSRATGQGQVASNMSNIAGNAPAQPSGLQSALGGAATGAGIGANFGPPGAGYGAAAGAAAGLLGGFEDGGVARSEGGVPVDRKALEDEQKQKAAFKKKYMKQIHDEMLGDGGIAKKEKYADGGIADPRLAALQNQFDPSNIKGVMEEKGGVILGQGNDVTSPEVATFDQAKALTKDGQELSIDPELLAQGLGGLDSILGAKPQERKPIETSYDAVPVQNIMKPIAAKDGGMAYEDGGMNLLKEIYSKHEKKEPQYASNGMGDIIDSGMDSFAGDRVDAKVNDGEAILNIPQQQRLMDLLRGEIGLTELGEEDIVEGVPKDYRDSLHEEIEEGDSSNRAKGLKTLLDALGKE